MTIPHMSTRSFGPAGSTATVRTSTGQAPDDFDALFTPLEADPTGALDGVHDMANMPLADEPGPVRDDLNKAMRHG